MSLPVVKTFGKPCSGWFSILRCFCLITITMMLCLSGFSQSTTGGAIGGVVYDVNSAVVPGATIVVHNNGTNAEQKIQSDGTGNYRLTGLQPATYTVIISSPGFAPYRATNVIVNVGSLTELSPKLNVGSAGETVNVSAEAPQVNTTSQDFAPTIDQVQIDQLPINGGRWSDFALLTPGVVNDGNGFGLISFRGTSVLLNNNTVDGADNNQAYFSEERGRTRAGYSTPRVAIDEFQVNTSNYSSEYGRSAGGVINTVTKSGTNKLHGEAYFLDRDNDWGAKNPFVTLTQQTSPGVFTSSVIKPKDWRKIWGMGVGGPVIKDKLFFYFSFDRYLRNFPGVAIARSPAAFFASPLGALGTSFDNSSFPGASCSKLPSTKGQPAGTANLINATSNVCELQTNLKLPTYGAALADYNSQLAGLLGELGTVPRQGEQLILLPKVDWIVNSKNHVSLELNRMRWSSPAGIQTQASVTDGIASFGNDFVKDTWGVGKLDTTISNTATNEVRYQYGRDFEFEHPQQATAYESSTLLHTPFGYNNPLGFPPDVFVTNGFDFGAPTFLDRAALPDERRQQFADTVSLIRGKHNFKFGGDYSHVNDLIQNLFQEFGTYSYNDLGAYFSDVMQQNSCTAKVSGKTVNVPCYSSFAQGLGPAGLAFSTNDFAFFGQDDWKLFPRLTVNLGLRWEYERLPNVVPGLVNPAIPQSGRMPSDSNNYGPRVGFAWDIFGDGKTALRGGYGIYYGRIINSTIFNTLIDTGSPNGQLGFSLTQATGPVFPQVLTGPPAGAASGKPNVQFFDPHFQAPQIHETDLSLERDLGWNTVVSASYLGSYGRELPGFADTNVAPAGTPVNGVTPPATITYNIVGGGPLTGSTYTTPFFAARLNPSFGFMTDVFSGINSSYNALALQVNHRMSHSVQFSANYTWAHAIDFGQNQQTGTNNSALLIPGNVAAEKGNSIYNIPNRFVLNMVADSPWHLHGWLGYLVNDFEISPIFQAQNGLPFSLTTSGTASEVVNGTTVRGLSGGVNGSGGRSGIDAVGRNTFTQSGTEVVDLRLSKSFTFRENYRLEFLGEGFNLFNHQNVTSVGTSGYSVSLPTGGVPTLTFNPTFSTVQNVNSNFAYTPRQVELGIRLHF